ETNCSRFVLVFFSFSWVQVDDVSTHTSKVKSLWNELNNGLKAKSVSGLPDLMLMDVVADSKTLDELTVKLCTFERNFMKFTKSTSDK
ncbi:hypothetical protein ILUMI_16672, partial [Ignelater luminosus]